MGYKLNCGIELTECKPGDSFIFDGHPHKLHYMGGRTHFDIESKRQYMICQDGQEWDISKLTPTEETKRKVAERKLHARNISIQTGVNVDHKKMSKITEAGTSNCLNSRPKLTEDLLSLKYGIIKNNEAKSLVQSAIDTLSAEPLARIIDWRGGEEVKALDFVMLSSQYEDYRAVVMEVISPTEVRTCRGMVNLDRTTLGGNKFNIIRINTAAIPQAAEYDQGRC